MPWNLKTDCGLSIIQHSSHSTLLQNWLLSAYTNTYIIIICDVSTSIPCWWYWRYWVNCVLDNPHRECSIDLVAEAESWWLKYEKKRGDWWNQNGAQREVPQPSLGGLYPQPPPRARQGVCTGTLERVTLFEYMLRVLPWCLLF